jgi:hypothetical protein
VHNGNRPADIFVVAVPYNISIDEYWLDITGTMNPEMYNGTDHGVDLGHEQFSTATVYRSLWGFRHNPYNIFIPNGVGGIPMDPTLAVRGHHKRWGGVGTKIDESIYGNDAMGRACVPEDFNVMNGSGAAAYAGSGAEGIIPRHRMV